MRVSSAWHLTHPSVHPGAPAPLLRHFGVSQCCRAVEGTAVTKRARIRLGRGKPRKVSLVPRPSYWFLLSGSSGRRQIVSFLPLQNSADLPHAVCGMELPQAEGRHGAETDVDISSNCDTGSIYGGRILDGPFLQENAPRSLRQLKVCCVEHCCRFLHTHALNMRTPLPSLLGHTHEHWTPPNRGTLPVSTQHHWWRTRLIALVGQRCLWHFKQRHVNNLVSRVGPPWEPLSKLLFGVGAVISSPPSTSCICWIIKHLDWETRGGDGFTPLAATQA